MSEETSLYVRTCALTQLYLRTLFILFLSPLFPGSPGEGPDSHFPKEIEGLGPIPTRIQGKACFS